MKKQKKIFFVGGARPNFMKISPVLKELRKYKNFIPVVIHTGQHYDYEMSESFFEDLDIRKPDYFLGVGSGTHSEQTAKTMFRLEKVCIKEKPSLVIVVGDVNSTLASSLTAKKLNIKVAHIEAGLRSFDMSMPEEINRIVTDSISDFLFVTEKSGVENLEREGRDKNRIFLVGNTMIDSLAFGLKKLNKINLRKLKIYVLKNSLRNYGVITLHRPNNVDDRNQLLRITNILNRISAKIPLVFSIHPRTKKSIRKFEIKLSKNIYIVRPLGYLEFLYLYKDAKFVLTDSGGLQEETTFLGIPCLTLRSNTERPITVLKGTNSIIGTDFQKLSEKINAIIRRRYKKGKIPELWDGQTAKRIVGILDKNLNDG